MKNTITAFLILISTLGYSQKTVKPITIPFDLSPNGHIIITAKVNGVEGKFIFDTGAGMNLLIKKFADKITDLEKTNHFHTGHRATGEAIMSDLWKSKSLEIGNFEFKNDSFAVFDLNFPIDGLISLTPFANTPITINYKRKELIIENENSLEKRNKEANFKMPIKINSNKGITLTIATDITLNNKLSLLVNLDSGAGFGVYRFNSRYMENLGIDSTKTETEVRKSIFKPEYSNTFFFTKLDKLVDIENNAVITNINAQFISGLIHEGIMGIDWIGNIITIDIKNKVLIVKK